MRKNLIRMICFGILAFLLWGCGKTPAPSDTNLKKEETESDGGILPDGYVLSASFEDAGGDTRTHHDFLHSTRLIGNSLYYYAAEFDRNQSKVVTKVYIQERGKEARLLNLSAEEERRLYTVTVGEDGCLYLLYHINGENDNIESYTLEKRDKDLQLVYSVDTTASLKETSPEQNVYITFMEADADGKLYGLTLRGLAVRWDEAGVYQGCVSLPVNPAETLTCGLINAGPAGIYAYWSGLDEKKSCYAHLYDLNKWLEMDEDERKDATPLQLDLSSVPEFTGISSELLLFSGYGEGAYLADRDRLWQIDLTDGSTEPLLVWQDAYLKAGYVREIRRQKDDSFLLYAFDSLEQENYWVTLKPVPANELPEKTELVLGIADNSRSSKPSLLTKIDQVILSYNRTHPYSHVTVQKYPESSLTNLQLELINGKGPDILMERESFFDMATLMSKGALEDLAPYLADSGEISDEDILPGILKLITEDGRIPRIPLSFSAGIMILPKDRPQEIMTPEEAARFLAQDEGEDEYVDMFMWPQTFLIQILSGAEMDRYVDTENSSCSFDSEEFISLLEQAAKLADMQMIMDHRSRFEPFRSGRLSAIVDELSCMGDYLCIRASLSDIADITGYPNSGRELRYPANLYDRLGINSASGHKEEAWGFVEFCLAYISRSDDVADRFAVTKDKFDRQTRFDNNDPGSLSHQVQGNLFLTPGYGVADFGPATQEETDFLQDIPEHLYLYENEDLLRVISEETSAFFAGDISAREAAERIQNRASLMLAE